ncbi:L-rhamnose mutarotase [Pedobacter jejuensis]|uniref:L-rhamnose mutarotase n=1 Tax=Pedobacter jejuensis TaxID=1268550 RepID=A0A3N0BSX8_9SPHI|nr:L-rhamnose mutarotase [Pedobacter jejuensis]RNL52181.1 L-rhamnose mutarotase [Pedobacter jejuensis]
MKVAFKMKIKAGFKAEYKARHDMVWPELATLLKEKGISDYSIFLDEQTDTLFAVQRQNANSSQDLGTEEIVQKWWAYMADIMETNEDKSPKSFPLEMVFHLD